GTALANARQVIDFEQSMGLYFEDNLQGWLLEREAAMRAVNTVYSFVFLAATVWTLLWLFVRDRENYRLFRNALGISTVLAIITIALLPVAPPRLVAESGLVDSVVHFGREHDFANEYAAIPSLHVGWMALAGFVIGRSLGGWRGRVLGMVPGGVMGFTVIVTGNHYWIDGMIGAVYSVGPALVMLYWKGLAATGARTGRVILATPRLQLSLLAMGGLLTYLLVAQATAPGFTDFWWYLVVQMAAILVLLTVGEVVFRDQGGISWQTHIIAATCSYLDVLGTDGNLYARIDEYDKLTHFMGVAAITSGAYDIFRGMYARGSRRWVAEDRLMAAVTIGVAVGVGWEVYEYLGDAVFHTTRIQGRWDTTNDIISDSLGAMVAGIWLWWSERSAEAEAEPAPGRSGPTGTA
ncbi:MAG: phosphatase PAP2 family protein, partial [Dehalococcoidia bacterium]